MKKNHKKERLYAWLIFSICLCFVLAALTVAGFFAYKYFEKTKAEQEAKKAAELEVQQAKEAEIEEEIVKEAEEESFDQDTLDAIFDETDEEEPEEEENTEDEELSAKANEILSSLTIEQKVAQMFFIKQEAITGVELCTAAGDMTKAALEKYPVGGIIYFADNIEDPKQICDMTENLQEFATEISGFPIFIGVDEEGGSVARIGSNGNFDIARYDSMKSIGDTGNVAMAYEAGNSIGSYLKEFGFNVDFAPDADVLTNPDSIIGDRSFGEDSQLVADMSAEFASGLKDAGVIACMKHFPGHGAVAEDTHEGNAVIDKGWDELESVELLPFYQAIADKVPFIMVSHISLPALTGDEMPASLSGLVITDKLRGTMGYSGVIITDSLSMSAISKNYSSAEAAVAAIQAGNDMLLMPENFEEAYNGVLNAIEEGSITEDRINESVLRILKEKLKING